MILAAQSFLVWFASSWVATLIGIALGVAGVVATIGAVGWVEYKFRLRKDIEILLTKCRESEIWDDKSELKLIQWMLDTPEDRVHHVGLFKLRSIRGSLNDYLYLHLYGRDPVPLPGWIESTLQSLADRLRYRRENRVRQKKNRRKQRHQRA